tara:strand:+ start:2149 stop:2418 length:270 start_codon:yes stop_codon:yes gene_type:complete
MREYILKIIIAVVALYFLFKITIGGIISGYETKIKSFKDYSQREIIKEKIFEEIKKGTEKDRILTSEESLIISNFLNKIIGELNLKISK